jgi:hypothetical protein
MNAAEVLAMVRAAGVRIRLDGDDLIVKGATPGTLDLLRLHKPEIVEHLRVERFVAKAQVFWSGAHVVKRPDLPTRFRQ